MERGHSYLQSLQLDGSPRLLHIFLENFYDAHLLSFFILRDEVNRLFTEAGFHEADEFDLVKSQDLRTKRGVF